MRTICTFFTFLLLFGTPYAREIETVQHGKASWYSTKTSSSMTASGRQLINHESVAAHKTLPFGTIVKVTNLKNGKTENVEIIDKGPFIRGRIIDVSVGVAERLGFKRHGVVAVKIEVVKKATKK